MDFLLQGPKSKKPPIQQNLTSSLAVLCALLLVNLFPISHNSPILVSAVPILANVQRPPHFDTYNCQTSNNNVIIVGAGISGLSAARSLQAEGCNVVVLEARNRVGGRIWFNSDHGVNFGAQWIHGSEGNPLMALAQELNITTQCVGGDPSYIGGARIAMFNADGSLLNRSAFNDSMQLMEKLSHELDELRAEMLQSGAPDISVWEAYQLLPSFQSLSQDELRLIHWHFAIVYGGDWAASPENLSLFATGDDYFAYLGGDSEIKGPGGFYQFPLGLARGLDIRLQHEVKNIHYSSNGMGGVSVTAVDRNSSTFATFKADFAIVTVPIGVLKKKPIAFSPPLPARKAAAIERLDSGVLNKIILRFDPDKVFWPRDQYTFGYVSTMYGELPMIVNALVAHDIPALIFMVGGDAGTEAEKLTNEQNAAHAMKILRTLFGPNISEPVDVAVTRWMQDEYAYGSYLILPVGSSLDDISALAEPIGNFSVLFAGEATSEHDYGMSFAAYLSGQQVASLITGQPVLQTRQPPQVVKYGLTPKPLPPSSLPASMVFDHGTPLPPAMPFSGTSRPSDSPSFLPVNDGSRGDPALVGATHVDGMAAVFRHVAYLTQCQW